MRRATPARADRDRVFRRGASRSRGEPAKMTVMQALERLAELWAREQATVATRAVADRRETPLARRVARGDALRGVEVEDVEVAPGGRTRLWVRPPAEGELRLRPGSPVRLWWDDPDGPDAVRATAGRRRRGLLALVVDRDVPDRLLHGRFNVDRDDPQTVFQVGRSAIDRLRRARPSEVEGRWAQALYGDAAPPSSRAPTWTPRDADLNESQREAVGHALGAARIALLHGPPGTGKTRTLVEVVAQAVARGERVLATAMSNTAVDRLAAGLIDAGLTVVRLGHPTRVHPRVEGRSLDTLIEATEAFGLARGWVQEARRLRDRAHTRRGRGGLDHGSFRAVLAEARRLERDAREHLERTRHGIVDASPILCATVTGARTAVPLVQAFDLVVLDEATQVPDPLALAALGRAPKAVLAGDPEQLPPTIIDPEAARAGLGCTLFERLAERWPAAVRLLEVQYRMHADLMAFPATTRYDGRLRAAPEAASRIIADLGVEPDPSRDAPLILVDTAGKGWDDAVDAEGSAFNPEQALRTAAEVRRLLSRGLAPQAIGLITPYNAHRRRLRDLLAPEVEAGLEIRTVDGFQGREKEAIVVDLVRSNAVGEVGFVADRRRLNVAFTRARRLLLVVADTATLGRHPDFAVFLEVVEARGIWLSAWSDEAEPL